MYAPTVKELQDAVKGSPYPEHVALMKLSADWHNKIRRWCVEQRIRGASPDYIDTKANALVYLTCENLVLVAELLER